MANTVIPDRIQIEEGLPRVNDGTEIGKLEPVPDAIQMLLPGQAIVPTQEPAAEQPEGAPTPLHSRIASHRMDEAGLLHLVVFAEQDRLPAFAFVTGEKELRAVAPQNVQVMQIKGVDLLKGADARWRFEHSGQARSGKNHSPGNTVEDRDTYFLGSVAANEGKGAVAATATLLNRILQASCEAVPGKAYELTLLAALQRCDAQVVVSCLDTTGTVLQRDVRSISPDYKGGTSAVNYHNISLIFVAPERTAKLSIQIEKIPTIRRETSYVFFADVALRVMARGAGAASYAAPAHYTDEAALAGLEAVSATLRPPSGFGFGKVFETALHVDFGTFTEVLPGLEFPVRARAIETRRISLYHRNLKLVGRLIAEIEPGLLLAAYVDGEQSATAALVEAGGEFTAEFTLDVRHLDGQVHVIEVRQLLDQLLVASLTDQISTYVTPWSALQSFAGMPLDINASPAARFHFQTYRSWLDETAKTHWRPQPNLARLHDELLAGFQKRTTFPLLEFPEIAEPLVSIVIPAHNKFEITYHCLASILFAFDEAPFEIIVVDDGSSDATNRMSDWVRGVRYARHPEPLGFVVSCNDGAALARGQFICFLNNDTEVTSHWLDELLHVFTHFPGVGLAGSKLIYPNGRLQEAGGIVWNSGNPWNVGRNGNPNDPRYNYLRQVDYVSGAAILLRRGLWQELGGFSAEYAPGYFEDTDLSMKVLQAGHKVVYVPTSQVIHHEGQSAGTSVTAGMKRFQEINRPKFRRKWAHIFSSHGAEGSNPDREKDRSAAFRVLLVDHRFPFIDADAGGYSAFQEIRLLQSFGAKVTFLPRNLAYMDRHVLALQRIGVECLYAPFVSDFAGYLALSARDYDLIYVIRHGVARDVTEIVRKHAPAVRIAFNPSDLHFLRESREAVAGVQGASFEGARITRDAELAMVQASNITLSYSDTEKAILESHLLGEARVAKLPWVVETSEDAPTAFAATSGLLFIGGFRHPPNLAAVQLLAKEVMPILAERCPEIVLTIVGSHPPEELQALDGGNIRVLGYVAELDPVFAAARVFVAPLMAGAGMKGKVLEAISRGVPSVLSAIAAEGIGMASGNDYLLANTTEEWAQAIAKLHRDQAEWERLRANAQRLARERYSFEVGRELTREWLAQIEIFDRSSASLVYGRCRPIRYGR